MAETAQAQAPSLDVEARLALDDFSGLVGQDFAVDGATGAVSLVLEEAVPARHQGPDGRHGFGLLFRGPGQPALTQGLHPLRHPATGCISVFLVPVGPAPQGLRYEAIFN